VQVDDPLGLGGEVWRPVWIWFSAAWSLSVVQTLRTKAMSSTQVARCGHQSVISTPAWPCFFQPTCMG